MYVKINPMSTETTSIKKLLVGQRNSNLDL
jgi:hypothetical protein